LYDIETRFCRYVDDVLNHHHLEALADYMTPDVVSHSAGLDALLSAFADFHLTIDALVAFDGELMARMTATGRHTGRFFGIRPTGQRVRISAFAAWQLSDGRCREQWLQLDLVDLLQQLGSVSDGPADRGRGAGDH
jgi:predicted ester cyclase